MINVMLVCNAGMSTAMLAQKINKNCDGYCFMLKHLEKENIWNILKTLMLFL